MTAESPYYTTVVLFGREQIRSVIAADVFPQIVGSLTSFLERAGCPLSYRGVIEDARARNLAPRKGRASSKLLSGWQERLPQGTFKQIEIFDSAWSDERFPDAYAALNKIWDYGPSGYLARTRHGAENNVTLALRQDALADRLDELEAYARDLAAMTDAFYGFVEREVQWDREVTPEGIREDMIDVRWYERTEVDYGRGEYRMDALIPRLYWGNLLSSVHFRDGGPATLPSWAVERVEAWGDDRFYVRFARDPQTDARFHEALAPFFKMTPP